MAHTTPPSVSLAARCLTWSMWKRLPVITLLFWVSVLLTAGRLFYTAYHGMPLANTFGIGDQEIAGIPWLAVWACLMGCIGVLGDDWPAIKKQATDRALGTRNR